MWTVVSFLILPFSLRHFSSLPSSPLFQRSTAVPIEFGVNRSLMFVRHGLSGGPFLCGRPVPRPVFSSRRLRYERSLLGCIAQGALRVSSMSHWSADYQVLTRPALRYYHSATSGCHYDGQTCSHG